MEGHSRLTLMFVLRLEVVRPVVCGERRGCLGHRDPAGLTYLPGPRTLPQTLGLSLLLAWSVLLTVMLVNEPRDTWLSTLDMIKGQAPLIQNSAGELWFLGYPMPREM